MYWDWYMVMWAVIGAFGTAYMHQETGRDPRWGGLIGLAVGFFLGIYGLVWLWIWLYYRRNNVHIIRKQRRWYEWWRP